MNIKKLAESLNPVERKVIKVLDNFSSFHDIMKVTGLKEVEVARALQWLQNKSLVKTSEGLKEVVSLDENGRKYLKDGLPERKFLESLENPRTIAEISEKTGLISEEIAVSLGVLKSKAAIEIEKGKELVVSITDNGKHLLKKGFPEEQFLREDFPRETASLNDGERHVLDNLRKRKRIVKVDL